MNIYFDFNEALMAVIGGALIGLSATIMLLFKGRITGISGITTGAVFEKGPEQYWRLIFILGLVLGGVCSLSFIEDPFYSTLETSKVKIIIAGLLVGIGTTIGSGCTSGHGVCGISRLSKRSIIATLTFMASGILTVLLLKVI